VWLFSVAHGSNKEMSQKSSGAQSQKASVLAAEIFTKLWLRCKSTNMTLPFIYLLLPEHTRLAAKLH
jgi:hypothetical protein